MLVNLKLKMLTGLLCLMLAISLTACGNTDNVTIEPIESSVYSQDDYDQAVDAALNYFQNNFADCTMTEIRYAGDDRSDVMKDWAEEYGMDEVIILSSDFTTGAHCDNSLNRNSTYTDWQWILARNKGGKWAHKDHGYG